MDKSRLLKIIRGAVIATLIFSMFPLSQVKATDLPSFCYKTSASIWWAGPGNTSNWPVSLLPDAQSGANYWESLQNWQGTAGAINIDHNGTASNHTVKADWSWSVSGSSWGYGICSLGFFVINANRQAEWENDPTLFKSVVAHEFGHVLGLAHVGTNDSWDGLMPIMSTCRGSTTFSQDDAAGANALTNQTGTYFNATANSSFENGDSFWGRYGGLMTERFDGGVDGSARHIEFSRTENTAYIFSTTRISDNQGHTIDWIKARANYRKSHGQDVGYVTVVLRVGRYNYPDGDTCGWPDFVGYDGVESRINGGSRSPSWLVWNTKNCWPSSSWGYCTVAGFDPSNGDVFDGRVYVYSRMSRPGIGFSGVDLDRVRVMVDF